MADAGRRVRIHEVALRARVSTTTASRVLSDLPGKRIRPETRQRVPMRRLVSDTFPTASLGASALNGPR